MSQLVVLVLKVLYFVWFTGEKVQVRADPLAAPPQQQAGVVPRKAPVIVQVAADGSLSFEGQKLAIDALQRQLAGRVAREKDLAVAVRADAAVTMERLTAVVEACSKSGVWNVSFGVEKEDPAQPQFEEEQD